MISDGVVEFCPFAKRMNQQITRCQRFRGRVHKPVVAVMGGTMVLLGITMIVHPGPDAARLLGAGARFR